MAGTGDKLMTASEIKEVTDTKLVKDFSSLTALSGTPATGDLVPIKSGNETYKINYNALASAILGQISSNGVVNVANGGTGSNSATGALSGLIGALDTSSGFSLSDTIPVSINGTVYTITGTTFSNAIVGGGTGVTATLPIVNGGTGAASASDARTALDVYSKSETTSAISQSTAWVKATSFTGITPTETSATLTEIVVPELQNAKELLFVIGNHQRIACLGTNQDRFWCVVENFIFGADGSQNYSYSAMVSYQKSTKKVGFRQTYKGASESFLTLSEVWYR